MNLLRLALLTTALLAQTAPLFAATVSIVQPARPTPEVALTLSRIRGELSSVGLAVTTADSLPVGQSSDAEAVIAMANEQAPLALTVWLAKPPSGHPEVIRVAVESDTANAPEMLALRTIEVLRANLFEVDWAVRRQSDQPATPPVQPPRVEAQVSSQAAPSLGLEAGAAVLTSLDGVGPALLPTIRVGWSVQPHLVLQAALAGLGTQPTVSTAEGRARISQQYGLAGASYRFRAEHRFWPFLSLALGAHHTSVVGSAISPAKQDSSDSQWSFLLDGGVGIGVRLWGRTYATLAAHMQMAMPYVRIHLADGVAATSGRPNALFVLTIGAWL